MRRIILNLLRLFFIGVAIGILVFIPSLIFNMNGRSIHKDDFANSLTDVQEVTLSDAWGHWGEYLNGQLGETTHNITARIHIGEKTGNTFPLSYSIEILGDNPNGFTYRMIFLSGSENHTLYSQEGTDSIPENTYYRFILEFSYFAILINSYTQELFNTTTTKTVEKIYNYSCPRLVPIFDYFISYQMKESYKVPISYTAPFLTLTIALPSEVQNLSSMLEDQQYLLIYLRLNHLGSFRGIKYGLNEIHRDGIFNVTLDLEYYFTFPIYFLEIYVAYGKSASNFKPGYSSTEIADWDSKILKGPSSSTVGFQVQFRMTAPASYIALIVGFAIGMTILKRFRRKMEY